MVQFTLSELVLHKFFPDTIRNSVGEVHSHSSHTDLLERVKYNVGVVYSSWAGHLT